MHKLYIALSDLSEAGVMPAATVTAFMEQPAFVDLQVELQDLLEQQYTETCCSDTSEVSDDPMGDMMGRNY